ncbi:MAG TPA: hypothetical protein VG317_16500 [Pseudonocardiaceae bacterium]|jgi:hypothetical protein|nr:hypothetical protein [Pseudonocardiaceae bacterium]
MWSVRRRLATAAVVVVVLAGGTVGLWFLFHPTISPTPGCVVAGPSSSDTGSTGVSSNFTLSPAQTDNAATIAGVGLRLGMPDHAVTVALATAMQESGLVNLTGGDRDSAGLFQQRPSQGWGTYAQITDPVYASTAFYDKLRAVPGWATLDVTAAAQAVQHSAAPDGYAQWESEARAMAIAFTGEAPAALSCHDLTIPAPSTSLINVANAELGTAVLSGQHDPARGWALASWLVGHAQRLGVDQVSFDGRTWTAASGTWSPAGPANGTLALHQVPAAAG